MSSEAQELIEAMPASFQADKAGTAKALIQLSLTGDSGGEWVIDVADGKCDVRQESAAQSDVKVTMDAGDFVSLIKGQLNAIQAFMGGKIKISGNVGLVMQMMNWFDFGA